MSIDWVDPTDASRRSIVDLLERTNVPTECITQAIEGLWAEDFESWTDYLVVTPYAYLWCTERQRPHFCHGLKQYRIEHWSIPVLRLLDEELWADLVALELVPDDLVPEPSHEESPGQ